MATLKNNYHTHNRLCNHATGEAKDYVLKAIELNMEEIGLTDHGPIPTRFMSYEDFKSNLCYRYMSEDIFENVYLKEVDDVINEYGDKIKIYKGLETEYLPYENEFYKNLRTKLDYLNLGIHYFMSNGKIANSYSEVTYQNVIDYAENAVSGMESGLFKILVHPDLFMFDYHNINGERKFDDAAIKASKMIIESSIKNNVYLEINCNGIPNSRKYHSDAWLYPYYEFWQLVKEYPEAKVIIGVDAHSPESLDSDDIKDVLEFVNKINIKVEDKVIF